MKKCNMTSRKISMNMCNVCNKYRSQSSLMKCNYCMDAQIYKLFGIIEEKYAPYYKTNWHINVNNLVKEKKEEKKKEKKKVVVKKEVKRNIINTSNDLDRIPLIRHLSSHCWNMAMTNMVQKKCTYVLAGTMYGIDKSPSPPDWEYYITRKTTRDRKAICHSVNNNGIHHTQSVILPKASRCIAHNKKRINITGKGSNRAPKRCKNKTYGKYCHVHLKTFNQTKSNVSYIN